MLHTVSKEAAAGLNLVLALRKYLLKTASKNDVTLSLTFSVKLRNSRLEVFFEKGVL